MELPERGEEGESASYALRELRFEINKDLI